MKDRSQEAADVLNEIFVMLCDKPNILPSDLTNEFNEGAVAMALIALHHMMQKLGDEEPQRKTQ